MNWSQRTQPEVGDSWTARHQLDAALASII